MAALYRRPAQEPPLAALQPPPGLSTVPDLRPQLLQAQSSPCSPVSLRPLSATPAQSPLFQGLKTQTRGHFVDLECSDDFFLWPQTQPAPDPTRPKTAVSVGGFLGCDHTRPRAPQP